MYSLASFALEAALISLQKKYCLMGDAANKRRANQQQRTAWPLPSRWPRWPAHPSPHALWWALALRMRALPNQTQ